MSNYWISPVAWMSKGNCYDNDKIKDYHALGKDPFYDPEMTSRAAKIICRDCPVLLDCYAYAVDNNECGIWGGQTERERRNAKKLLDRRLRRFVASAFDS